MCICVFCIKCLQILNNHNLNIVSIFNSELKQHRLLVSCVFLHPLFVVTFDSASGNINSIFFKRIKETLTVKTVQEIKVCICRALKSYKNNVVGL